MKARSLSITVVLYLAIAGICANSIKAQQTQSTSNKSDDVISVNTNLVQTDVMVFDKNGKFVKGLKREQFVLKVDGKVRDISFFEYLKSGKVDEEVKLAAARGEARSNVNNQQPTILLDRGRTVFLFVDDLHLSAESTIRMKKLLTRFVDREIGQNDQAAIITASGQLGFLQQLTDNKSVLLKAINNLKFYQADVKDYEYPQMTVYQALLIDRGTRDLLEYFRDELIRQNPGMRREQAEQIVLARSRNLLQQSAHFTDGTLQSLRHLIKESAKLPGRKLIFFITDGFLLDTNFSDATNLITQVTSQAAKANVIIYSLDARGLVSGFADASSNVPADPSGRLHRNSGGEVTASQDGLYALAKDTGGRALINTNDAEPLVKKALDETSEYYLLAWTTDDELIKGEKFRKVEVSVADRPNLIVKSRKGFLSNEKVAKSSAKTDYKKAKNENDTATKELLSAIQTTIPIENLPTVVSAFYYTTPQQGVMVSAAVELQSDALTFELIDQKTKAVVDAIGVVFDINGKNVGSFQDRWTITAPIPINEMTDKRIVNSFQIKLAPGLYQIRIATREVKSGKVGNASMWLDVPDLSLKKLTVGSLILGERKLTELQKTNDVNTDSSNQPVMAKISRRFSSSSYLRFFTNIYNASLPSISNSQPDIAMQVQIFRDDQPVTTTEASKLQTKDVTDFLQIPYAAEVSLQGLPVGFYVLQVTAIDRIAKTSATEKITFTVE